MIRAAVFVSGGGTNLQALLDRIADGRLPGVEIAFVLSSRPGAFAEERARRAGIRVERVVRADFPTPEACDARILALLDDARIDLVVLAGFLSFLGPGVTGAYRNRILNVHPALLPAFGGPGMYGIRPHRAALESGVAATGATVHFVDEAYDHGPIVLQKEVAVLPGDTPETLQARVMAQAEQEILPEAVRLFAEGRLRVEGGAVRILPQKEVPMIRRAILSVSDKTGLADFAKALAALGVELVSTGGTAKALADAGLAVRSVSDLTGFPECLDGRVKTLHPKVHGGILAMRSNPEHMARLAELGIGTIDLVVINLYPFKRTVMTPGATLEECVENIDIGGPGMLRAAAKNHPDVTVVTDPADYALVLDEMKANGGSTTLPTRYALATKVFEHTAAYDALIADYLRKQAGLPCTPEKLTMTFERVQSMRYGENPHQRAVFYRTAIPFKGGLSEAEQVNGKEMSYNNIVDTDAAIELLREFDAPTVVAVKHANPCGVACGADLLEAWRKAFEADMVSIYGGIVAANREIDEATAAEMDKVFLEVVVAPSYSPAARELLCRKKNLRVLVLPGISEKPDDCAQEFKRVNGGLLVQDRDAGVVDPGAVRTVTRKAVDPALEADLEFAMKVCKHVKSNAIVMARDLQTVGIGPGQPNRITSVRIAAERAGERSRGAVMASDAFFPFSDCVEAAAAAGIACIVQPGGSVRDAESIEACDNLGLSMRFTGMRHFWH